MATVLPQIQRPGSVSPRSVRFLRVQEGTGPTNAYRIHWVLPPVGMLVHNFRGSRRVSRKEIHRFGYFLFFSSSSSRLHRPGTPRELSYLFICRLIYSFMLVVYLSFEINFSMILMYLWQCSVDSSFRGSLNSVLKDIFTGVHGFQFQSCNVQNSGIIWNKTGNGNHIYKISDQHIPDVFALSSNPVLINAWAIISRYFPTVCLI